MDNDIFTGFRPVLNDTNDTSLLLGGIIDHKNGSSLISIEAERRMNDNGKLELEARLFVNISITDPTATIARDDYLTFRLSRYF